MNTKLDWLRESGLGGRAGESGNGLGARNCGKAQLNPVLLELYAGDAVDPDLLPALHFSNGGAAFGCYHGTTAGHGGS
jgi:hypothetical protein